MQMIETVGALARLADRLGVRDDWHEPDEQGVSARVVGDHLDNAMGASGKCGERVVIISKDGKDVASVNLATLLAWAVAAGRHSMGAHVNWSSELLRNHR